MPFELRVALRYLRAKRKAGVSMTGLLTVAGVALGVLALTVVTSVWNGFEAEFLDKLLGINAHSIVLRRYDLFREHRTATEALRKAPGIVEAAPFVYSEVILQGPTGARGVGLKGLDPDLAPTLPLAKYVGAQPEAVFERLRATATTTAAPGMLIGTELQDALKVQTGDIITVVSPYGGQNGQARTHAYQVAGVFHSGMYEFDSRMVFIGLKEAQRFFKLYGSVTGVEVWTTNPMDSYQTVGRAVEALDPDDPFAFEVRDWSLTNAGMFGAVRSQKSLISIVLFIIVIVAAFNILATLILLILEKAREIAVLESLGATARSVLAIFVIDGLLIGAIGVGAGVGLGLLTCGVLQEYGLRLDPRVYYLEQLPIIVNPLEVLFVSLGALSLSVLATLYPALRAARTSPVDGLTRRTSHAPDRSLLDPSGPSSSGS